MNKKKILIGIIVFVVLIGAYYLISPAFKTLEVNDEFPTVNDAFSSMTDQEKEVFQEAVDAASSGTSEMLDSMPQSASIISQGAFIASAHEVSGTALVVQQGETQILRFEDFETINGPNLHIYLSSDLGSSDFVDLGRIKATKGNVNYEIPEGTDLEKYDKVLVWCVPFNVLFSYSDLE